MRHFFISNIKDELDVAMVMHPILCNKLNHGSLRGRSFSISGSVVWRKLEY